MNNETIPEVFATFEKKLAHILSYDLKTGRTGMEQAITELLIYFSCILARTSKAEAELEMNKNMIKKLVPVGWDLLRLAEKADFIEEQLFPVMSAWRKLMHEWSGPEDANDFEDDMDEE